MRFYFSFILLLILVSCGGNSGDGKSLQTGDNTNFTGTWAFSEVKHTADGGINANCAGKEFNIIQSATKISISTRQFICNGFTYAQGGLDLTVSNGKLTVDGQNAGEVGPNYIHFKIDFNSTSGPQTYSLYIDSTNEGATYNETYKFNGSSSDFSSSLKRY